MWDSCSRSCQGYRSLVLEGEKYPQAVYKGIVFALIFGGVAAEVVGELEFGGELVGEVITDSGSKPGHIIKIETFGGTQKYFNRNRDVKVGHGRLDKAEFRC